MNRSVGECHGDTSTRDNTTEAYLAFLVASAQSGHLPDVLDVSAHHGMPECTCNSTSGERACLALQHRLNLQRLWSHRTCTGSLGGVDIGFGLGYMLLCCTSKKNHDSGSIETRIGY